MNTGIISSRYARALLLYTIESGCGSIACRQAEEILSNAALPEDSLCEDLQRLVALMMKNHREHLLRPVLSTFVRMYYDSQNVSLAHLTVAVPSQRLESSLREVIRKQTGRELKMEVSVDPELIGGFVLTVDDYLMDASVKGQLESIRRQFIEKNRTTV